MSLYEKYKNMRDWLGIGAMTLFLLSFFAGLGFITKQQELEAHPLFGWTTLVFVVWIFSSAFAKLAMLPKEGEKEQTHTGEESDPEQTTGHWLLNLIALISFIVLTTLVGRLPDSGPNPFSTSILYVLYKLSVDVWILTWIFLDLTETAFHLRRSRMS